MGLFLSGDEIISASGLTNVAVVLSSSDIYNIQSTPTLARSPYSTFITIPSSFATDLSGNAIQQVYDSAALIVTTYTSYTLPIPLISVAVNVDQKAIVLTYADLVDLSTIDVTQLTLSSSSSPSSNLQDVSYTLQKTSVPQLSAGFAYDVGIQLSDSDLNAMEYSRPLLSDLYHTFTSTTPSFAYSSFGNSLQAANTFPAASFVPNYTPARLVQFEIDLSKLELSLNFSLAIDSTTIDLTKVTLQSAATRRFGCFLTLSPEGCMVNTLPSADCNVINIVLSSQIVDQMRVLGIARTSATAYLTLDAYFALDFYGVPVAPVYDGSILGKYILCFL